MAIETILPDATTTPNPAWSGAPHTLLSDQGSNITTCAGSQLNKFIIVSFGNLTSDIGSINSITFSVAGNVSVVRGESAVVAFDLLNSSDSSYSLSENKTFDDTTFSTLQAGTTRTTSDGSTAWTESDVNGLRMKVTWATENNANCVLRLDHLYINVDYNVAPLPVYDNTLNNITLNSGTITISGGNIILN